MNFRLKGDPSEEGFENIYSYLFYIHIFEIKLNDINTREKNSRKMRLIILIIEF